jgi:hypothetical protein
MQPIPLPRPNPELCLLLHFHAARPLPSRSALPRRQQRTRRASRNGTAWPPAASPRDKARPHGSTQIQVSLVRNHIPLPSPGHALIAAILISLDANVWG